MINLKLKIDDKVFIKEIDESKTILESIKEYDVPFSCESGYCSTCMCKLIYGEVNMIYNLALTDKEVEKGYILTCKSYAKTDIEITFD